MPPRLFVLMVMWSAVAWLGVALYILVDEKAGGFIVGGGCGGAATAAALLFDGIIQRRPRGEP